MNEALLQRLATLEGESAVRRLMACYMDLCDMPRAITRVSELEAGGDHHQRQGQAEPGDQLAAHQT
jgi:hypothetical protein